jgi:hypothetical protein
MHIVHVEGDEDIVTTISNVKDVRIRKVFKYAYMFVSNHTYVHIYAYRCLYICIYICMYVCVYINIFMNAYLHICVHIYKNIHI